MGYPLKRGRATKMTKQKYSSQNGVLHSEIYGLYVKLSHLCANAWARAPGLPPVLGPSACWDAFRQRHNNNLKSPSGIVFSESIVTSPLHAICWM